MANSNKDKDKSNQRFNIVVKRNEKHENSKTNYQINGNAIELQRLLESNEQNHDNNLDNLKSNLISRTNSSLSNWANDNDSNSNNDDASTVDIEAIQHINNSIDHINNSIQHNSCELDELDEQQKQQIRSCGSSMVVLSSIMSSTNLFNDNSTQLRQENNHDIMEVLRQVVRTCTNPDTSKRPSASEIYELLNSYL